MQRSIVGERLPRVRVLPYKPALVVSGFSLKQRRQNEYDFIRFAEEQFVDGWFDVLLVHSLEAKIDRIQEFEPFGALILDTYEYENENVAFERLQDFAQNHKLILLSSGAQLFRRIQSAIGNFPNAEFIERSREEPGEWLESLTPTAHYQASAIRRTWGAIRRALDSQKIATNVPVKLLESEVTSTRIQISTGPLAVTDSLPVIIETTYFPNWRREDGKTVYAATPFFMLTFIQDPTQIVYARRWIDQLGLILSLSTAVSLLGFIGVYYRKRLSRIVTRGIKKQLSTQSRN